MYSYIIRMSLVCTRMSSVCHSYVLVYNPYVTRMYSHVIRMSIVCTRMSSVCHSYVLVCYPYVTRMYSYAIRMSLICGFTMNLRRQLTIFKVIYNMISFLCLETPIQYPLDFKFPWKDQKLKCLKPITPLSKYNDKKVVNTW